MKINDKVRFKDSLKIGLIGSGYGIGIIKDFDGDFIIIETGIGKHYINKKDVEILK